MLQDQGSLQSDNFSQYKNRLSSIENDFELGLFLHILKRNLILIAIFFIVSVLFCFVYLRYTQPVYESFTTIKINQNNNANKVLTLQMDDAGSENSMAEAIEIIRSKVFLSRVVNRLDMSISYFNRGTFKNFELYKTPPVIAIVNKKSENIYGTPIYFKFDNIVSGEYSLNGNTWLPFKFNNWNIGKNLDIKFVLNPIFQIDEIKSKIANEKYSMFLTLHSQAEIISLVKQGLEVKSYNESAKTIKVTSKNEDPSKAADIANAVSEEFLVYDVEQQSESSNSILSFINGQIKEVYSELKSSEDTLDKFKKDNNINSNSDRLISSNISRLTTIEDQILKYEIEEKILDEIQSNFSKNSNIDIYQLLAATVGTESESSIRSLIEELKKILQAKENLLYQVTPNSENIKAVNFQIENQKKLLVGSIASLKSKTRSKILNLKEKAKTYNINSNVLPKNESEYARLFRLFSVNEKYYTLLMEKRTEFSIAKAGFVSQNIILENASINNSPVSPNKFRIFLFAFLAAFLLSLLTVFFKYILHDKIYSLNEIIKASHANVSVLGIVPKHNVKMDNSKLIVDKQVKSIISESFRALRSNLAYINADDGESKVIAATSSISGEGKTFVSINLAGILALAGKKVVIIDLDLRKPSIHKGFNLNNDIGTSLFLINKKTVFECIKKTDLSNLDVITSGPIPPNPSELIINGKLEEAIIELKKHYDYIVLDTPPIGLVTDGIQAILKADFPIYIFRADYSRKNFVQLMDRLYNDHKLSKLSIVLNNVDLDRNTYGYNYAYGYGFNYGYGYGKDYYTE
jgi:tyrosine-protein kinase Etk/Wzc